MFCTACIPCVADDVLDEYINKAAKLAGLPTEPTIQEEPTQGTPQPTFTDSYVHS